MLARSAAASSFPSMYSSDSVLIPWASMFSGSRRTAISRSSMASVYISRPNLAIPAAAVGLLIAGFKAYGLIVVGYRFCILLEFGFCISPVHVKNCDIRGKAYRLVKILDRFLIASQAVFQHPSAVVGSRVSRVMDDCRVEVLERTCLIVKTSFDNSSSMEAVRVFRVQAYYLVKVPQGFPKTSQGNEDKSSITEHMRVLRFTENFPVQQGKRLFRLPVRFPREFSIVSKGDSAGLWFLLYGPVLLQSLFVRVVRGACCA